MALLDSPCIVHRETMAQKRLDMKSAGKTMIAVFLVMFGFLLIPWRVLLGAVAILGFILFKKK